MMRRLIVHIYILVFEDMHAVDLVDKIDCKYVCLYDLKGKHCLNVETKLILTNHMSIMANTIVETKAT